MTYYDNILPRILLGYDPAEDDKEEVVHEMDEDDLMEYQNSMQYS